LKNIQKLYLSLPKKHKVVLTSFFSFLLVLFLIPSEDANASRQNSNDSLQIGKRYSIDVPGGEVTEITQVKKETTDPQNPIAPVANKKIKTDIQQEETPIIEELSWQTAKVKSGDSLAKIFKRLGFSPRTTHDVAAAKGENAKMLKKLNVGDTLKIGTDSSGKLVKLTYPKTKTDILHINLVDGQYITENETKEVELRQSFAHGTIKSNFWSAGVEAGLNDNQIISLANIFGWDIDFALDIRSGDSFHITYEDRYIDGEYIGPGKILAAEFVNQDDPYRAIRFTDGEYYTPDGKSMRKAFLRAPVNFKYISSNFKRKRFHPVQKRWKSHRGTDYAAKTGTPVVAAGNGKVTHSTYNKYNGNYVFIQHGNGIVTKYLHFSKRKVKKGQRVKQGQVIGYVGSTGLASGPHLHYEFLLNGVHRNPRTVKLPDAKPIAKKHKAEFLNIANARMNELSGSKNALYAMQPNNELESE